MNQNMTTLDRRLRALLVPPRGRDRDPARPGVGRIDCAVRARRDHARDQRRRLLPALLPFGVGGRHRQPQAH